MQTRLCASSLRGSSHVFTFLTFVDTANVVAKVDVEKGIDQWIALEQEEDRIVRRSRHEQVNIRLTYSAVDVVQEKEHFSEFMRFDIEQCDDDRWKVHENKRCGDHEQRERCPNIC